MQSTNMTNKLQQRAVLLGNNIPCI